MFPLCASSTYGRRLRVRPSFFLPYELMIGEGFPPSRSTGLYQIHRVHQYCFMAPPSMVRVVPVMKLPLGEARNEINAPRSCGLPNCLVGEKVFQSSRTDSTDVFCVSAYCFARSCTRGVSKYPGQTTFTVTPSAATSVAMHFAMAFSPVLRVLCTTDDASGSNPKMEPMKITRPYFLFLIPSKSALQRRIGGRKIRSIPSCHC